MGVPTLAFRRFTVKHKRIEGVQRHHESSPRELSLVIGRFDPILLRSPDFFKKIGFNMSAIAERD